MSDQFRQISQKFAQLLASVETKPEPMHGPIFDTKVVSGRPVEVKYRRHFVRPGEVAEKSPPEPDNVLPTEAVEPGLDLNKPKRTFLVRRPEIPPVARPLDLAQPSNNSIDVDSRVIDGDVVVPHGLKRNQSQLRAPSEAKVLVGGIERAKSATAERPTMGEKSSVPDFEGLTVGANSVSTLQKIAIFLLSGAYDDLGEVERMDRVDLMMESVGETNAHMMFDVVYWSSGWKDGGKRIFELTEGLKMVSLVGLVVLSDRAELLSALSRTGIDVRRQCARVIRNSSTRAVSAIGLGLQFKLTGFFQWLDARGRSLGLAGEPAINTELSETLRSSIRRWVAEGSNVSNDQLMMICVLLKLGATIDEDSLSLVGTRLEFGASSDIRRTWAQMAKVTAHCDLYGVAALQILISAAGSGFDVLPVDGMDSPLTPYVVGNQIQAVEMLLASGVNPECTDAQGLTARDHGIAAGAEHCVALIDVHVARRNVERLERSAVEMKIVDRLFEGVDFSKLNRAEDASQNSSRPAIHELDFKAVRELIREASRSGFIAA